MMKSSGIKHMIMMANIGLLSLSGGLLVGAAVSDLHHRKIPNWISVSLFVTYALLASLKLLAGHAPYDVLFLPSLTALVIFLFGVILFAKGVMGGGDVKLMAVMGFFAGTELIASFLLFTALIGGIIASIMVFYRKFAKNIGKKGSQVPYGIAISASGVWVLIQNYIQFEHY